MVTIEPTFQWRDASHGTSMQARGHPALVLVQLMTLPSEPCIGLSAARRQLGGRGVHVQVIPSPTMRLNADVWEHPVTRTAALGEPLALWGRNMLTAVLVLLASGVSAAQWHIWVEDSANEHVYHAETWLLTKKMMRERTHRLSFTIPIFEPLPSQYYIRCMALLPASAA